jgi:hypothetical protein
MKQIMASIAVLSILGCSATPKSFVRSSPGWKTIELQSALQDDYDTAWQRMVDTIARTWDIELLDKGSGYLRTSWTHGISGGSYERYRGRLTVKFPEVTSPEKLEVRTQAQWLRNYQPPIWVDGFDTRMERDVYTALAGRLGRTVPTD